MDELCELFILPSHRFSQLHFLHMIIKPGHFGFHSFLLLLLFFCTSRQPGLRSRQPVGGLNNTVSASICNLAHPPLTAGTAFVFPPWRQAAPSADFQNRRLPLSVKWRPVVLMVLLLLTMVFIDSMMKSRATVSFNKYQSTWSIWQFPFVFSTPISWWIIGGIWLPLLLQSNEQLNI